MWRACKTSSATLLVVVVVVVESGQRSRQGRKVDHVIITPISSHMASRKRQDRPIMLHVASGKNIDLVELASSLPLIHLPQWIYPMADVKEWDEIEAVVLRGMDEVLRERTYRDCLQCIHSEIAMEIDLENDSRSATNWGSTESPGTISATTPVLDGRIRKRKRAGEASQSNGSSHSSETYSIDERPRKKISTTPPELSRGYKVSDSSDTDMYYSETEDWKDYPSDDSSSSVD
ncbi:hypothetical protein JR316_0012252 [Psilocybe cubensis]|uniref:Uncharacterized protein n=2 Tax=Psilocybe cubensis TaxID=181762 RepID=A0ACB8GI03_PSICU|nr:hypothetical protein JR316_0012252 [Psilocybe cubensis]KAH9475141.1 hypothetical protein JR316_0012252 [Psilocybe cubensis]